MPDEHDQSMVRDVRLTPSASPLLIPITTAQAPKTPHPTSPVPANGSANNDMVPRPSTDGCGRSLLDLPLDLCLCVFDYLPAQDRADLASLARTCKTIRWPATKALYKYISLDFRVADLGGKKLVSLLQLIHVLLRSDKPFLTMVEQITITLDVRAHFSDVLHGSRSVYSWMYEKQLSDIDHFVALINMQVDQQMEESERSRGLGSMEVSRLIFKGSPNLRYIEVYGCGEPWNLQLHNCKKLETVKAYSCVALTLQGTADLALIPNLKRLQLPLLPALRLAALAGRPFTFSHIPQAQFPSLVDLKLISCPSTAKNMADIITMAPRLRLLEIGWGGYFHEMEDIPPSLPISSMLTGAHSTPTRPAPQLDETLEKFRIYSIWLTRPCRRNELDQSQTESEIVKKWDENFFGSFKFLRSLKIFEISMLAPIGNIIHLLPDSLEELHLTDENYLFYRPTEDCEDISDISAALAQLRPAGLHSMKAIFLKFRHPMASPRQQILDVVQSTCTDLGIKLNVVKKYNPEVEWM